MRPQTELAAMINSIKGLYIRNVNEHGRYYSLFFEGWLTGLLYASGKTTKEANEEIEKLLAEHNAPDKRISSVKSLISAIEEAIQRRGRSKTKSIEKLMLEYGKSFGVAESDIRYALDTPLHELFKEVFEK